MTIFSMRFWRELACRALEALALKRVMKALCSSISFSRLPISPSRRSRSSIFCFSKPV